MVNREEVVYAYRLLLGREPESEAVLAHYAAEISNTAALRELFVQSAEFRSSVEATLGRKYPAIAPGGPPMQVDLYASPDKLSALFAKVRAQWHHLGQTEPHWSVLTNERFFQENFHTNRQAFYASGDHELALFEAALSRAGLDSGQFHTCLELGCGVGRATAPLARCFDRVLGVDISATHLSVAQDHLQTEGLLNVDLRRLDSIDEVADLGGFDVLYSRIVLQHNPPPVMLRLLADLLSQLNPGGVAFFQVPTYQSGYRFQIDDYLSTHNDTVMEMHFLPQAALFDVIAQHGCRVLEIREDDAIGMAQTAVSNTVLLQKATARHP